MIQIYHNSRCQKSRMALNLLIESGKTHQVINYLVNPPSESELKIVVEKIGIEPLQIVRSKEKIWIENYKNKVEHPDQIIPILSSNPVLIERPIVVFESVAFIVRTDEKLKQLALRLKSDF